MRPLRYLVHAKDSGKATVEITARTLQDRFLRHPTSVRNLIWEPHLEPHLNLSAVGALPASWNPNRE